LKIKFQTALQRMMMDKKVLSVQMNGMTKHEQGLRQSVADLKDEAKALMDDGKQDEAKSKLQEAKAAKEKLDNFLALKNDFEGLNIPEPQGAAGANLPKPGKDPKDDKPEYQAVFFKALRGHQLNAEEKEVMENQFQNAMTGSEDESGGLIIPEDIQTRINEFKRRFDSLEQYVNVEPVSTRSGSRVLEKNGEMSPLENITNEMDPINDMEGPRFENMTYSISDYAGILKISNTLLADTDQNLMNYLVQWIGKKSIVTRNQLILNALDGLTKQDINGIDGIKNVLNETLDPAISQNAVVVTNQSGFNYLDKLRNEDGTYVLQPNPTNPTQKLLAGKPVVVISNRFFSAAEGKAPVIIGDLKEAVILFDRQTYSIKTTDVGDDAFRRNTTNMRVIEREDVKTWDDEAVVYGEFTLDGGNGGAEG
jgi:HK97 family phage major capsid protein